MLITKISESLLEPILSIGKMFEDINKDLDKNNYDFKLYNQKIEKLLNENPLTITTVKGNWIHVIAYKPFAYNYIYPNYLKKDEEIISETKKQTIASYMVGKKLSLTIVPKVCNNQEIMELFLKDQTAQGRLYEVFIKDYLTTNVGTNYYDIYCPSIFRNPNNILHFKKVMQEKVNQKILSYSPEDAFLSSNFFNGLSKEFKNPITIKYLRKQTISNVKMSPDSYVYVASDLKNSPEIIEAAKIGWINYLKQALPLETHNFLLNGADYQVKIGFLHYVRIPQEFKSDPRIMEFKTIVQEQLLDFLNICFKKIFTTYPLFFWNKSIQKDILNLLNEFSCDNLLISIYNKKARSMINDFNNNDKLSGKIKIKCKHDYECAILSDKAPNEAQNFKAQSEAEVFVLEDHGNNIDIKFEDGSIIRGLNKNDIEVKDL